MSDELAHNKQLVARLYDEVFGQGRLDVADELLSEDYVNRDPLPGMGVAREDLKAIAAQLRAGAPRFVARIERIVAEGDLVAVQATLGGADGTRVKLGEFFRVEAGRIAERWG